ncbi:MAG: hypothetical protein RLT05_11325 [Bauldia litoralis]
MLPAAPRAAALFLLCLVAAAPSAARAEAAISKGILGAWQAKPFTWHVGKVKGCRYRQHISIDREVAAGQFEGTYSARTTCAGRAWNLNGRITVTVSGRTMTIAGHAKDWIIETVRYISPLRMEGKDARGHPMIYVRPKGAPTS